MDKLDKFFIYLNLFLLLSAILELWGYTLFPVWLWLAVITVDISLIFTYISLIFARILRKKEDL